MDDVRIIELFFLRDEKAINETQKKYGEFIRSVAFNITGSEEDSSECINDTYLKLWNSIPPEIPVNLKAYLGKIIRNSALSRYRMNKAAKRDCGTYVLLSELEECLPSNDSTEDEFDAKRTGELISLWLKALSEEDRIIFMKRYWYGESVKLIAEKMGISQKKAANKLFELRKKLKKELEQKGVQV